MLRGMSKKNEKKGDGKGIGTKKTTLYKRQLKKKKEKAGKKKKRQSGDKKKKKRTLGFKNRGCRNEISEVSAKSARKQNGGKKTCRAFR